MNGVNVSADEWDCSNCAAKSLSPGDEVMFFGDNQTHSSPLNINITGLFAFRRVISADGLHFTVDSPIDTEFGQSSFARGHYLYVYRVPNFSQVNITGGNIATRSQISVFRCTGNVKISNTGTKNFSLQGRYDDFSLSHSDLPDRMISSFGNIIICCGDTLTVDGLSKLGNAKRTSDSPSFRPAGYGGSNSYTMPVMIGDSSSRTYCNNILLAAKKLRIDADTLDYGANAASRFSGLCYMAGDMS